MKIAWRVVELWTAWERGGVSDIGAGTSKAGAGRGNGDCSDSKRGSAACELREDRGRDPPAPPAQAAFRNPD
ncbi:hypothetical protein ADE_53170 [Achromobacter denitrificans]|nr:hypothetical protein ADE_53170 [Achromobacter denitrificans]